MKTLIGGLLVTVAAPALAMADPHEVFGQYAVEDGNSHVSISDCGDGTPCGTVIWIDPASIEDGRTPEQVMAQSTGEPVLGMVILEGLERARNDWRRGTIYSPSANRTYGARIRMLDDGRLEVKGCIGPVCQTQHWTRLE